MTNPYTFLSNDSPLIISIPHMGIEVPTYLEQALTPVGKQLADTDWHLDRLYDFSGELNASVLMAKYSRYVVDLNRPANDESLYPGQTTTGLFPQLTFRGEKIFESEAPNDEERQQRLENFWQPYHDKLKLEIIRLKNKHGKVLVWEAHSIASVLPRLFDGQLPDLNIGTNSGLTADPRLIDAIEKSIKGCPYKCVVNDRFKGGYITRSFGNPSQGIHVVQLEMCQSTYMNESYPFEYRPDLANQVKPHLRNMIQSALDALKTL
jgi:N-formylglutamate deformylase